MLNLSLQQNWKKISATLREDQQTKFLKDSLQLYSQSPENYFFIYLAANIIGIITTVYMNNWLAVIILYATLTHFSWKLFKFIITYHTFRKQWNTKK